MGIEPLFSTMVDEELAPLVREFVDSLSDRIAEMDNALGRGDSTLLQRIGHQFSGAGGGYGFDPISSAGRALEQAVLRDKGVDEQVREGTQVLIELCRRAEVGLEGASEESAAEFGGQPGKAPALIVDDDFACRRLLQRLLSEHFECDTAVNGKEAIDAISIGLDAGKPYGLVCLDIDMPELDGHDALKEIRRVESARGILPGHGSKIIMTTAHKTSEHFFGAFREGCEAYLVKPLTRDRLADQLSKLRLLEGDD